MKDIRQILSSLGLLDSEIKTYLAALKNGASTVMELAKETKLSRQATYTAIEQLTNRGLVSTVQQGKKQLFTAEEPDKLLLYAKRKQDELKEQVQDLKQALPELRLQSGGEKPIVKVFEGKEGIRALLEDTRQSRPKQISEITDSTAMREVLENEDLQPYREALDKAKTVIRTISDWEDLSKDETRNIKRIQLKKNEAGFKSHISVHGDKIALVTFEGKMYTIFIESKALAEAMTKLFDLVYKK